MSIFNRALHTAIIPGHEIELLATTHLVRTQSSVLPLLSQGFGLDRSRARGHSATVFSLISHREACCSTNVTISSLPCGLSPWKPRTGLRSVRDISPPRVGEESMGSTLLSGFWTVLLSVSRLQQWLGTHWSPHNPRHKCYQRAGHENLGPDVCGLACAAQHVERAAEVPALESP